MHQPAADVQRAGVTLGKAGRAQPLFAWRPQNRIRGGTESTRVAFPPEIVFIVGTVIQKMPCLPEAECGMQKRIWGSIELPLCHQMMAGEQQVAQQGVKNTC